MIDLHIHSSCSDGGLAPREIVACAAARKLEAVAITDHDSIDGNAEAEAAGRALGVPVLAGVELSTRWRDLTFHLLGYGLRRRTPRVEERFVFLRESRRRRAPLMIEKLRGLGIDITLEDVAREAGGGLVGRPHFARVLLRRGVAGSHQEVFDRLLARGAPGYVDKARLSPAEACEVIQEADGVAVLAHPGLVEKDRPGGLEELLQALVPLGLAGLEVYYSRHTPDQVQRYSALARRHGLLVTGGSDFHRPGEGGPQLGSGFGNLRVPFACFEALRDRLARN